MNDLAQRFQAVDGDVDFFTDLARRSLADQPPERVADRLADALARIADPDQVHGLLAVALVRLAVYTAEADQARLHEPPPLTTT